MDADNVRDEPNADAVFLPALTGLISCALFFRDRVPDVDAAFEPAGRKLGLIGEASREAIGEAVAEVLAEPAPDAGAVGFDDAAPSILRSDADDCSRERVGFWPVALFFDWPLGVPFALSDELSMAAASTGWY